jgi:hypothetical protein
MNAIEPDGAGAGAGGGGGGACVGVEGVGAGGGGAGVGGSAASDVLPQAAKGSPLSAKPNLRN